MPSDLLAELPRVWRSKFDGHRYNLTNFRQHDWFLGWLRADPTAAEAARGFADVNLAVTERYRRFAEAAEAAVAAGRARRSPGSLLGIGSLFAFAIEPYEAPLVRARVFAACERAVGREEPPMDPAAERFAGHLDFVREARRQMEEAGIPIRDTLDVQSLLFLVSHQLGARGSDEPDEMAPRDGARAWVIRAGRTGENEDVARSEGVALIGWSELGELSPQVSREELKARIRETFDEQRDASLSAQASSIHRFVNDVQIGDVVVLPLQTQIPE